MDFAWGPGLPDPAGPPLLPPAPCFQPAPLPRGLPGCAYGPACGEGALGAIGRWNWHGCWVWVWKAEGEPWPRAVMSLCLLNTGSAEMSLTPGPSSCLSKGQGHYGFIFNVLVMELEMNTGLLFIFLFGFQAPSVVLAIRGPGAGEQRAVGSATTKITGARPPQPARGSGGPDPRPQPRPGGSGPSAPLLGDRWAVSVSINKDESPGDRQCECAHPLENGSNETFYVMYILP